jgi:hypothetical protein
MALQVAELSLELIEALRPLVSRIKAKDKSLADQIMRSSRHGELASGQHGPSSVGVPAPGSPRLRFLQKSVAAVARAPKTPTTPLTGSPRANTILVARRPTR